MQNNHRAAALIMKEYIHILYQIKQQKLGYKKHVFMAQTLLK